MVRKAVMDDFPVILNIYATARAFMAKTGNPTQWAGGHPSADLLRECILAQKLFVFTDPDDFSQIRGCFYFAIENDPTYAQISEGSWLSDAPYGVIHMVASDGRCTDFCETCWISASRRLPIFASTHTTTTRSCSMCLKKTDSANAASSILQTVIRVLPTKNADPAHVLISLPPTHTQKAPWLCPYDIA